MDVDPNLTVIVGRNGAGKTTILNAIASLLNRFQFGLRGDGLSGIVNKTHRRRPDEVAIVDACLVIDSQGSEPKTLEFSSSDTSRAADWSVSKVDNVRMPGGLSQFNTEPMLFVYYRQNRVFESGLIETYTPDGILTESLHEKLGMNSNLGRWWDERSAAEGREVQKRQDLSYRDTQLETIRELVKSFEGFEGIAFETDLKPAGLYLRKSDSTNIHIDQLSSGEIAFLILTSDLARRLHIVSPGAPVSEVKGIVLIDEIELNLHPAWQSKILKSLTDTFPACQFIVTTHSPQILSSAPGSSVRILKSDLSGGVSVEVPNKTRGHNSNYLLEAVFGTPDRAPETAQLFEEFYDAIDVGDAERAGSLLVDIEEQTDGDPEELPVLLTLLRKLVEQA